MLFVNNLKPLIAETCKILQTKKLDLVAMHGGLIGN